LVSRPFTFPYVGEASKQVTSAQITSVHQFLIISSTPPKFLIPISTSHFSHPPFYPFYPTNIQYQKIRARLGLHGFDGFSFETFGGVNSAVLSSFNLLGGGEFFGVVVVV